MRYSKYPDRNLVEEEIRDLLRYISKDPPYCDWLKIVSAVCHELEDEEKAYELLTEWSPDYGDITTWDLIQSLHGDYRSTAGTLYWFAKENGYRMEPLGVSEWRC